MPQTPPVVFKRSGLLRTHYTLTLWEKREDMLAFVKGPAHRKAMKQSAALSREIRTYTFETDQEPTWPEAKKMLLENGRMLSF